MYSGQKDFIVDLDSNPQQEEFIDECSFITTNLEKKQQVQLGKYDEKKKYLCVSKGLNIKGTCNNNHCPAYMKPVWVKKGYGNFDFAKIIVNNYCPICDRLMSARKFTGLGYLKTIAHITGVRLGKNEQEINVDFINETNGNLFTKYLDNPQDLAQWIYMNLEIKQKK